MRIALSHLKVGSLAEPAGFFHCGVRALVRVDGGEDLGLVIVEVKEAGGRVKLKRSGREF